MKAIWITKPGGPDVLEVREGPDPQPKKGEIRIKVAAAGLNFAEVMARLGIYPDAPPTPCVVGYEVAGTVDELGEGVKSPKKGTRVLALTRFGGHADCLCVPEKLVIPMPNNMSFEEGAALPVNYLTAYHMLFKVASLQPGEKVLIHMAAGGVGIAALQLCRTVKDVVTFGTSSPGKHDVIREQGCAHPIDYRTKDYYTEVKCLTQGEGVDIVLDPLGGKDWRKGYKLLRPVGRLIAFGFANMSSGEKRNYLHMLTEAIRIPLFTPLGMMQANKTVAGVNMGHLWGQAALLREEMTALLKLYEKGEIKPHIDATFPFEKAADAHRRIQSRQNIGKVILIPG